MMILILTHAADYYNVDIFSSYLLDRGIDFYRLNTDQFNNLCEISGDEEHNFYFHEKDKTISSKDIKGVWHRKTWAINIPEELDEDYRNIFKKEYESLRSNFYTSLAALPWINPLLAETAVERNKLLQLKIARESGLTVPPTAFTNNAAAVRNFMTQHREEKFVAKLHNQAVQSMSGSDMVNTLLFGKEDSEMLEDLAYCPMIIQPYIEKSYEVRVAYVNGQCFSGKINPENQTDWRNTSGLSWEEYKLPDDITSSLQKLMNRLGLIQGAIDLIRDLSGNYWFLEINPQGEWGMLQKELGYPIAEILAQTLIEKIQNA